nr:hypothetical protein [Tanacetum cinerariifolium]
MADHSQKWHNGTISRNIGSSSSNDILAALESKLDNLGRDIKKLKESVHGIQVGCQICEGPHLDKDCPLNEEVKQVEEVRYREFGHITPFNGSNRGKFCVRPPGYYTKTNNRPSYGEKRPSLKELLTKNQEESARRSTEMEMLCRIGWREIPLDKGLFEEIPGIDSSWGRKNGSRFRKMIMEAMEEVLRNDEEDSNNET